MRSPHANLPRHIYVNVDNRFLGPTMPTGVTAGIWHGVYVVIKVQSVYCSDASS